MFDDTIDMYFPNYSKVKILNKNSQNINDTYVSNSIPTINSYYYTQQDLHIIVVIT